ncbi:bifunctional diguanylate cyclase/phosphodiesterase [Ilumatobacter nonamiensis]|uniref:bifunctional diguanylate cyclase/phosphodiesterase n=1 Tax=Ilumatobacter nonamiensis TaxID=467093 RepID=UPI000684568B|nr:bifunctional diguanylate cyclase/phosphodiesterase [Ilumatobacter nonamiensis]
MTGVEQDESSLDAARPPRREAGQKRAVAEVVALSIALTAIAWALASRIETVQEPVVDGGPWTQVILSVAFGATLLTVFRIEFRGNAILFSLSEIPMIFALVYLDPVAGVVARLAASAVVFGVVKRPPLYKQLFNLAMFTFETALAYMVMRELLPPIGMSDLRLVLSATVAVTVAGVFGSIAVALAVSRFVGDTLRHIVDELRAAWVLVVNAAMAGAMLSLYLVSNVVAFLAIVPIIALWYMMRRHGILAQRLRDLTAIYGFAGRVGRSLDLDEIGRSAVAEAERLLRADLTLLVLAHHESGPVFSTSDLPVDADQDWPTDWAPWIGAKNAELTTGRALTSSGMIGFSRCGDVIVAPVDDETGPIGILVIARHDSADNQFSSDDLARATNLAEQLGSSLRKGMLHRRLQYEARHDSLTGLPNRLALQVKLADLDRDSYGRSAYVMMIDLDRFKEVNDTLGHHAGDELLIEFSRRLASELGSDDFLARLAGDEFAVVTLATSDDDVLALARRCIASASRPITLNGLSLVVTASIGIARADADSTNPELPLRHADIAMYDAKARRVGADFYREEADLRTPGHLSMLGDLRTAIENGELDVEFQPKLDLASTTITGVEALVRWTHDVRGIVSPTDFVRVAEESGMIRPLTNVMLTLSIAELRRLHDNGHHLSMSINLSTHDLLDAHLAWRVAEELRLHDVDASYLTLEITESSLLVDAPRTRATIQELHELGVRMSIDDFGTGYSSLSYLRKLPVSELKVDQSFVSTMIVDQQDGVIVRSTIELGHNLGLEVVAEGVETEQILERLRSFGCDVAQGYAISRPLAAEQFHAWLHTSKFSTRQVDPTRPGTWGSV